MRFELKLAAAAAIAVICAGCKGADADTVDANVVVRSSAAAPALLEVSARDVAFETRRSTPAGVTNIRLVNAGPDFHHVQLVRLDAGHTVAELMEQMKAHGEQLPAWATWVGGPNSPAPGGGVSEATVDLEAGEYAIVCVIPSAADGVPHVMKGMVVPLTVTPAAGPSANLPAAELDMVLNDYSFTLSREVAAGRRTIRVRNDAAQPHEMFIAKLAPGKNAGDLLAWMQKMDGPPPALPLGGVALLATGEENYLTLDLEPGEYGLYCFVPDARDHQPHIAHGMVRQITVK